MSFSLVGTTGSYRIKYTDAEGNVGSVTNSTVIRNLSPGPFVFELSDSVGFCTVQLTHTMLGRTDLSIDFDIIDANCDAATLRVSVTDGTPPYTYLWSNGQTTPTVLAPGLFDELSVTVTDSNGCLVTQIVDVNFTPLQILGLEDSTFGVTNSICGTNSGRINSSRRGGIPPYTYQWSNGSNGSFNRELSPGVYGLTITDATGCSVSNSYSVGEEELPFDFVIGNRPNPEVVILCDSTGPLDVLIRVSPRAPDFTAIYTVTRNGVTTQDSVPFFEVTEIGIYNIMVTVTFTTGETCSSTQSFTVVPQENTDDPFHIEVLRGETIFTNGQRCDTTTLVVVDDVGRYIFTEWTLPGGEMVSTRYLNIDLTGPGLYIASPWIRPGANCPTSDSLLILPEDLTCVTLQGYVFLDNNGDCAQGSLEVGLPNQLVTLTSANDTDEVYFAYTGADGMWAASLPQGDYLANVIAPNIFTSCADQIISIETGDSTTFVTIPLIPVVNCPQVTIDLNIPRIRRCFNSPVYLSYENRGTAVSENTIVTLEFGEWVDEVLPFFDPEPDAIGINPTTGLLTVTWNIGDVVPFERGNLNVMAYTCSADFPITTAACVTATVEPNSPCPPADENWTGASVNVSGTCQRDSVVFTLQNVGDANMSIDLQYIVIEDGVIIIPDPEVSSPLEAGASKEITLPANGSTYHVQVTQEPLHPGLATPIDFVEGCGQGNTSTGFALQFPVSDDAYWIDEDCVPIIGSYDPNDKLAAPKGYAAQNYIVADQPIDYQIRFQNTGNDTAFLVVIRDTISELLDLTTFELLSTTHDVKVEFDTTRGLAFIFENIMLPDSFVNEPASNGSVSFRIHPVADLGPGTEIENTASIYFDFNEAIVTNTYLHTVEEDFVAVFDFTPTVERLNVVPNPTAGPAYIDLPPALTGEKLELQIVDALGRVVQQYQYGDGERPEADLSRLPAGWYSLRLTSATQLVGIGPVLLQR